MCLRDRLRGVTPTLWFVKITNALSATVRFHAVGIAFFLWFRLDSAQLICGNIRLMKITVIRRMSNGLPGERRKSSMFRRRWLNTLTIIPFENWQHDSFMREWLMRKWAEPCRLCHISAVPLRWKHCGTGITLYRVGLCASSSTRRFTASFRKSVITGGRDHEDRTHCPPVHFFRVGRHRDRSLEHCAPAEKAGAFPRNPLHGCAGSTGDRNARRNSSPAFLLLLSLFSIAGSGSSRT